MLAYLRSYGLHISGLIAFFLVIFFYSWSYSQTDKNLKAHINPVIYRIGNIENQYVEVFNEYVKTNYLNLPGQEYRLDYELSSNLWGLTFGINYWQRNHELHLAVVDSYVTSQPVIFAHNYNIRTRNIGFSLGGSYKLQDGLKLYFSINAFSALENISSNSNYEVTQDITAGLNIVTPDSAYLMLLYRYNIITKESRWGTAFIIPDIHLSMNVFNHFNFIIGAKFQVWTNSNDWIVQTQIDGFTEPTTYNEIKPLHSSRIKNQGLYSYLGISYDIPLTRRR